jgi:hypothetical protein
MTVFKRGDKWAAKGVERRALALGRHLRDEARGAGR